MGRFEQRTPRAKASGRKEHKIRFKQAIALLCLALAGCATSSGVPAARILEPEIAGAYLPLNARVNLGIDTADGAAMVIAPGIAVTNAHNRRLVSGPVIGEAAQSDLLFFRVARGEVRAIVIPPGYDISSWFTYEANAGPGFSGGPVVDTQGRLVGITFAYKDEGRKRLIYAYDMARVLAELQALQNLPR